MSRRRSIFGSSTLLAMASSAVLVGCGSSDGGAAPATSGTGGAMPSGGANGAAGAQGSAGGTGTGGGGAGLGGGIGAGGKAGQGGSVANGGRTAGSGGTGNASAGASGATDSGAPPANLVRDLLALTTACAKVVSSHEYALDDGSMVDICALNGAVYWTADMDIDCDGVTTTECNAQTDCCYQNDTAFHNGADQPLTSSTTPYVVIPSDFSYPGLDTNGGGNVTAVLYQGKLQWAVFGDTGPTDIIGEASYACAEKLGIDPDPKTGGTGSGVTYITFVGTGTAPSDIENQAETKALGESLAGTLLRNN